MKSRRARSFDELIDEAEQARIMGWDFTWLDGRAVEERPSWRYFDLVTERAASVDLLLDLQVGYGSMIGCVHKERIWSGPSTSAMVCPFGRRPLSWSPAVIRFRRHGRRSPGFFGPDPRFSRS